MFTFNSAAEGLAGNSLRHFSDMRLVTQKKTEAVGCKRVMGDLDSEPHFPSLGIIFLFLSKCDFSGSKWEPGRVGVWQQDVVRAYAGNSDSVAFVPVVPQTHCMSLGKLPYFSVPCCTSWGEDK